MKMRIKNLLSSLKFRTLKPKLVIMCLALLILPSLIIGLYSHKLAKESLDTSGQIGLQNQVRMTIRTIEILDKQVHAGTLKLEDAQEAVRQYVLGEKTADGKREINNQIDVGENGYMFIYDQEGALIAHPTVEGKNLWDTKSPDGVYLAREFIAQANNGGGFTFYQWALPNNPEETPAKIAYSELDPYWGWVVCSGSYMFDYNKEADGIFNIVLYALIIFVLIGLIVTILFANYISNPIMKIAKQTKLVAEGDLTIEPLAIKRNDEIGRLAQDFNTMTSNLQNTILIVNENALHVASSAEQLMASSEQASQATEHIVTTIQEISSGADEQVRHATDNAMMIAKMSEGINTITENSQLVTSSALAATEKSSAGSQIIQSATNQMASIGETVHELAGVVEGLGKRSQEIGEFTQVITEIANQTNLLALNAAIEAARAGEQGRGFAVVSTEVRKLAEQSAESAEKISQLISMIRKETDQAVTTMQNATKEVKNGIHIVSMAGETFNDIEHSVHEVAKQSKEVSAVTKEIAEGTFEIVRTTDSVANVAEQAAASTQTVSAATEEQLASMEEISASAATLAEMSEQLRLTIQKFKV